MKHFIAIVLLSLWLPALAADLDRGSKAFENGDYRAARDELEPLAAAGDSQAQLLIGVMHAAGGGYRQDFVQAYKWLTLAARAGNEDALQARGRITSRMTRSQLRDAQSQANAFRPTALAQSGTGNSWSPPTDPLPSGRALIAEIQSGLSRLGYDPGGADGLMGRRTVAAIRDFQGQFGLAADGRASQQLLLAIRQAEADGLRASAPTPTARAAAPPAAGDWYFRRQDLNAVMKSLRALLERDDDRALRSGVSGLVQRNQWPWTEQVFRDDFKKPAGRGGLDWQVIRGEYAVRDGLLSDARDRFAVPAPPPPRRRSGEEQVLELLGNLLGGRVESNDPAPGRAAGQGRTAPDEVRLAAATGNRFLFRTRLLALHPSQGTAFVLQRSATSDREELRLRYYAAAQQLIIEHATGSGVRQIAASALRLEAGRQYNVEWGRLRGGLMQVALNSRLIIDDARSASRGGFDTFVWRNHGGSYLLTEVELHTRRRR